MHECSLTFKCFSWLNKALTLQPLHSTPPSLHYLPQRPLEQVWEHQELQLHRHYNFWFHLWFLGWSQLSPVFSHQNICCQVLCPSLAGLFPHFPLCSLKKVSPLLLLSFYVLTKSFPPWSPLVLIVRSLSFLACCFLCSLQMASIGKSSLYHFLFMSW